MMIIIVLFMTMIVMITILHRIKSVNEIPDLVLNYLKISTKQENFSFF